jgi:hypothetical protein
MKDLSINLFGNDTDSPIKNDLSFNKMDLLLVDGLDYVKQKLMIRLQFFFGEWYLDTTKGVKYYDEVLIQNPTLSRVQSILKAVISETTGVNKLLSFSADFSRVGRTLDLKFTVDTIYGQVTLTTVVP